MNSNWSCSPKTPNLGQIRWFFAPCDLAIWRMTLKNNRAPLVTALEKVQRKAARFTTLNYGCTCSVTSLLHQLGWRNLADKRCDQRLTFRCKIIHGHIDITTNSLGLTKPDACTHDKHRHKLQYPRASTRELQNFFTIRTVPEWNSLPASLTKSDSVSAFKSGLARLERSSV